MNSDTINNTPTTIPVPVRASKCCGCCCDYRRAVIIVDTVIIVLELLVILLLATDTATYYFVLYQDDDIVKTEMIFSAMQHPPYHTSIFLVQSFVPTSNSSHGIKQSDHTSHHESPSSSTLTQLNMMYQSPTT